MSQVLRRFAVLGSSSLLTQLIAFFAIAVAARRVGPSALGAYTVALAIMSFASLPQSSGITMVGVRDVAKDSARARVVAGEVFAIQMLIAVVGYGVILLLAPTISADTTMRRVFPIVGLFLFTGTSFEWGLQALGQMRAIAVSRIAGQVVYGALVPILVTRGHDGIEVFAWLMIVGLTIKHVIGSVAFVRAAGVPRLPTPRAVARRVRASLALGYTAIIQQVYGSIDQIMLGYFSTTYDAGEYAAAYRIPGAFGTFLGSWTAVIYPHSARVGADDPARLRREAGRLLSVAALLAIPLAACTPFVAGPLMTAAFGAQYGAAGPALSLLMVTSSLGLIDATMLTLLLSLGRDRYFVGLITATAALNVVINIIVIPHFGRNGAAVDTIASELLAFFLMLRGAKQMIGGISPEWGRLTRLALAVCPAVLTLIFVPHDITVWARIAAGAAVYLLGVIAFGAISPAEIRAVHSSDPSGSGSAPSAETPSSDPTTKYDATLDSVPDLPTVSVVVPTYRRPEAIQDVIDPLLDDPATTEVIVVVDGCPDGSRDVVERLSRDRSRLRGLYIENSGDMGARDAGARAAIGEVVLFVDDDVIAEPGLVSGHARHHAGAGRTLVLGYMPLLAEGAAVESAAERLYAREYEGRCLQYDRDPASAVRELWGGNFSLLRTVCVEIGLSNPTFTEHYHADRDFGIRCTRAGVRGVFDRSLRAQHRHRRDLGGFIRDARSMGAAQVLMARLHPELTPLPRDAFNRGLPVSLARLVDAGRRPRAERAICTLVRAEIASGVAIGSRSAEEVGLKLLRRLAQQRGAIEQSRGRRPSRSLVAAGLA